MHAVRWGEAGVVEAQIALGREVGRILMEWREASAKHGWGMGRLSRNAAMHGDVSISALGCVLALALEGPLSEVERRDLEGVAAEIIPKVRNSLLFAVFSSVDGKLSAEAIEGSEMKKEEKLACLVRYAREAMSPGEALVRLGAKPLDYFFGSKELGQVWRQQGWEPLCDEEVAALQCEHAEQLMRNPEAPGLMTGRYGMGDVERAFKRRDFGGPELEIVLGRVPVRGRWALLVPLMRRAGPVTRPEAGASEAAIVMVNAVLKEKEWVDARFILSAPDAWVEFMDEDPANWRHLTDQPVAVLRKLGAAGGAGMRHYEAWLRTWSEPGPLWRRCAVKAMERSKGRETMARDLLDTLLERTPGRWLAGLLCAHPEEFGFLRVASAAQLPLVVRKRFLAELGSIAEWKLASEFFGRDVLGWALEADRRAGERMILRMYRKSGDVRFLLKCVRGYGLDGNVLGLGRLRLALLVPLLAHWKRLGGGAALLGWYAEDRGRFHALVAAVQESEKAVLLAALRDGGKELVRRAYEHDRERFLELAVVELGPGELWSRCHLQEGLGGLLEKHFSRGALVALVPAIRAAQGMAATDRYAYELAACFSLRDAGLLLHLAHHARKAGAKPGCAFDRFYKVSEVPKKSGGRRVITAPSAALKRLQRRMVDNGLGTLALAESCHGFRPGHSILSNASAHVGREMVVNVDIRGFFPSTLRDRVFGALYRRYSQTLSGGAMSLLTEICCYGGALATGAPTSPVVANLVLTGVDRALEKVAARFGIAYTRYADDLTFSGGTDTKRILPFVVKLLRKQGYELDPKKTQIYRRGRRQMVTGLVVNVKANVPRWVRRRLRAAVHRVTQGRAPEWDGREMSAAELGGRVAQLAKVQPGEFRALREAIGSSKGGAA